MNKYLIKYVVGLSLVVIGSVYLSKKTGFFESDRHLYDEFEA